MASVKIVLRKKANKDGTYPLALRITKDRKSSYIHLGYHCREKDWDASAQRVRKSHPNSVRLNAFIAKKVADANEAMLDADVQNRFSSADAIKRKINPAEDAMFFAQADVYLQRLKDTGNFNRWKPDRPRLRNFKEFVLGTKAVDHDLSTSHSHPPCNGLFPGEDVAFSLIDVGVLTKFRVYLKASLKLSDRTIANYMMAIQAVFSQAIREGYTEQKFFPFGTEKFRIKVPQTQKTGLTKEELDKLVTAVLTRPAQQRARDVWMLSFYFAGMRAADVLQLKWNDFQDGRLYYVMGKNKKPGSLKVPEKAQEILDRYAAERSKGDEYIFPYLEGFEYADDPFLLKKRIAKIISNCDKELKKYVAPAAGLNRKLSLHLSRHTFASLAGDKIPVQMLQKLYRHSDIKTTIGYQANFINKDADEALDAVLR